MSSTSGWVDYDGNGFGFPYIPTHQGVWNMAIIDWCELNNVIYCYKDPYWVYAQVTKKQIQDFIKFVYVTSTPKGRHDDAKNHHHDLEILRSKVLALPSDGKFILSGYDY